MVISVFCEKHSQIGFRPLIFYGLLFLMKNSLLIRFFLLILRHNGKNPLYGVTHFLQFNSSIFSYEASAFQ